MGSTHIYFCVVLLCVFIFRVPCCDVRYYFRMKTLFGSSLPPVVCRRAHVLFTLFVFACVWWCPAHIVLCFCFVCVRVVYPMLQVFLCCPFYLPPLYSLTFIKSKCQLPHVYLHTNATKCVGRV